MAEKKPLIGFIGQGWIGRNYADDFEKRGFSTVRYSLEEPYVKNRDKIKDCGIVFIAVPTPTTPHGFSASIVEEGLALIPKGTIAVIKSTILPGTTKKFQEKFPDITIFYAPEFLSEATAAHDAANPFSNIIGMPVDDDLHRTAAEAVLAVLPKAPFTKTCSSTEAELIKYSHNASGYVQIILFNMLYDIAHEEGADWAPIQEALEADPYICNRYARPIHKSGRGAGGGCFIKDFAALRELYEKVLPEDTKAINTLRALECKNIELLMQSKKDPDLLRGVYGEHPDELMRLLITTQAVDEQDPFTSFFVGWLDSFAKHFERIEVVCLKEGEYNLPQNVRVHSLGKESGPSRIKYISRLYSYAWNLRDDYDAVLVHMNQEYVLLAALLWKLLGKKVYLWRNHQVGNYWTTLAVKLSDKVFCTSTFSYTAQFPKTVLMPVGVDTNLYRVISGSARTPRSILFFARFGEAKRPHMLIEALGKLKEKGISFTACLYGTPLPKDMPYLEYVKDRAHQLGLDEIVKFENGVPHSEGPNIFNAHEISVNLAKSGMYDKTIFEAAACGCLVLACSKDFAAHVNAQFVFVENDLEDLVAKLEALLALPESAKQTARQELQTFTQENSLETLSARLAQEIQ